MSSDMSVFKVQSSCCAEGISQSISQRYTGMLKKIIWFFQGKQLHGERIDILETLI